MGHVIRQEKQIAGFKHGHFRFFIRSEIVQIEFAFELVEDFIPGIDVIILPSVGSASHERDEVRVLPDNSPLPPVVAVFVDPLL